MKSTKKMFFFDFVGTFGGAQQSTATLLNEIFENFPEELDVTAVVVDGTNKQFVDALKCPILKLKTPSLLGFNVFRVGRSYLRLAIYYVFCIKELIKLNRQPDTVFLCNSAKALVLLSIFKLLARVDIEVNYYCRGWGRQQDFTILHKLLLRKFVSKIFCVSSQTKKNLSLFIDDKKLFVTYTSVKLEDMSGCDNKLALDYKLNNNKILFAGAVNENKGLHIIIKALASLQPSEQNMFSLLVAGNYDADMEYRKRCLDLIDTAGLTNIVWLGWRTDVPEIVSQVDIVCLPSVTEGMPRVVQEGMFYSKLVISTNVGGVCDLISDGRTGFIIDRNEDSLRHVLELIVRGQYDANMGANAKNHFTQNFHISKQVETFLGSFFK